ncbi:MAG: right-handed parallel beta-helix repeat-containing protein, partial [Anaerolineae bacterium]
MNSNGTQDLSLSAVIPAIQSSFQSWENVTPATIDFTYSGTTAQKQNNDGTQNVVFWGSGAAYIEEVAFTLPTYDRTTEKIIDVDIFLNDDHTWKIGQLDWDTNIFDVQSVLTHEIGHLLGISHSSTNTSGVWHVYPTMASYNFWSVNKPSQNAYGKDASEQELEMRSLATDDRNACNYLYGSTLRVPEVFPTIQDALDFAQAGQTVQVSSGTQTVTSNLTVPSGIGLTILAGVTIQFNSNKKLYINGTLTVNGTTSNAVTFTRSGASGTWGGIQFNNGSSGTIEYATIDHAAKGIYVNNTNNVTIDHCTIQNFTEQGVYADSSSLAVQSSTVQNPSGASHGIYLSGGPGNPTITGNTIEDLLIGIERKDSPGAATIAGNTFVNCRDGVKTTQSSPNIYNNYFDGMESADHGIRIGTSSAPNIHDNDFYDYTVGVYVEQSEPSELNWNNFGYTDSQMQNNEDVGLYINYLTSNNSFADNNWNNFYDGNSVTDVFNNTAYTLKARENYWDSASIEGSVDSSSPQANHNANAGPGGTQGKSAVAASETESEQQMGSAVPERFGLQQNFPNPFNPSTVIRFQLPAASSVSLIIYDLLGRRVRTLLSNAGYSAGHHQLTWDGRD